MRQRPVRVYAVIPSRGAPQTLRSRHAGRLRVVRRGPLAAIVGDSVESRPTEPAIRRYDRTLREMAERLPAILPARFGTAMVEDELIFILSSRRGSLTRALRTVRGRVQMTVRVVEGDTGASGAKGAASAKDVVGRPLQGASSGREYLLAKVGAATAARRVPAFEPIRVAVAKWIRDERVTRHAGVASIYHLIPRSSVNAYARCVHEAADAAGVRLVVSGPWPPYAFAAD